MYESSKGWTREKVLAIEDRIAGYRNSQTKELGLNKKGMEAMQQAGLSEYLVRSYLEAKYSELGRDYNLMTKNGKQQVIPMQAGVDQPDRVISDPGYLAFLSLEHGIELKDVSTTKTLNQAGLPEILHFKPTASILGFTGTPEGIAMLLKLHLGRGVEIVSGTEFKAVVIEASGTLADRADQIIRQIRAEQGILIFCENTDLFKIFQEKLGVFGDRVKIIEGGNTDKSIVELCKGENADKIILSNIRGATGYSYEDLNGPDGNALMGRDVVIADAENWTVSNIYQGIYRNDRQQRDTGKRGQETCEDVVSPLYYSP